MKKVIELNSIELSDILGIGDGHLKLIESSIPVSIAARGDQFSIKGNKNDVEAATSVLNEMRATLSSKGALLSDDVNALLSLYKAGEKNFQNNTLNLKKVIFYGRKGAIGARTKGQLKYFDDIINNDIVFGIGPAGTGKTFLSMAIALSAIDKNEVERIILCRPAVEAGENLGFLPGDLKDKVDPYLSPLYDALDAMLPKNKLQNFIDNKKIEIVPLAYMRGRTLDNAFLILDEAQNTTVMQMKMFLTRLGIGSKAMINGDVTQIDLDGKKSSGLVQASKILQTVKGIGFTFFDKSDIVRHPLVMKIISAYDKGNSR